MDGDKQFLSCLSRYIILFTHQVQKYITEEQSLHYKLAFVIELIQTLILKLIMYGASVLYN